jgi:hypothetical protein
MKMDAGELVKTLSMKLINVGQKEVLTNRNMGTEKHC